MPLKGLRWLVQIVLAAASRHTVNMGNKTENVANGECKTEGAAYEDCNASQRRSQRTCTVPAASQQGSTLLMTIVSRMPAFQPYYERDIELPGGITFSSSQCKADLNRPPPQQPLSVFQETLPCTFVFRQHQTCIVSPMEVSFAAEHGEHSVKQAEVCEVHTAAPSRIFLHHVDPDAYVFDSSTIPADQLEELTVTERGEHYEWKYSPTYPGIYRFYAVSNESFMSVEYPRCSRVYRFSVTVLPTLTVPSLRILSILTPRLGDKATWIDQLKPLSQGLYTAFHLTPVQPPGVSQSAYSILDHLSLNKDDLGLDSYEELRAVLGAVRGTCRVALFTDLVWNHAARNATWIADYPDSAYTLENSPHLKPAYDLDRALFETFTVVHLKKAKAEMVRVPFQTRADIERGIWSFFTNNVMKMVASWNTDLLKNAIDVTKLDQILQTAMQNLINQAVYEFVDPNGPRREFVRADHPTFARYFTEFSNGVICANNGWIFGAAGEKYEDFADDKHISYLRRDIVAWSDSVRLRYGRSPDDAPELWRRMRLYTEQMCSLFDGIRLDNLHNTPPWVAEYLVECGRKKNPNVLVLAELFTGRQEVDFAICNRLGIHLLVREGLHPSSGDEMVSYLYSSIRSFSEIGTYVEHPAILRGPCQANDEPPISAFDPSGCRVRWFSEPEYVPRRYGVCLYDCTHDNQTPTEKFGNPIHSLPLVALTCLCNVDAHGSTYGFDAGNQEQIPVTNRTALSNTADLNVEQVVSHPLVIAKKQLYAIAEWVDCNGFTQCFIENMGRDIVHVVRENPFTHEQVHVLARCVFSKDAMYGASTTATVDLGEGRRVGKRVLDMRVEMESTGRNGTGVTSRMRLAGQQVANYGDLRRADLFTSEVEFDSDVVLHFEMHPASVVVFTSQVISLLTTNHLSAIHTTKIGEMEMKQWSSLSLSDWNRILFGADCEGQRYEVTEGKIVLPYIGAIGILESITGSLRGAAEPFGAMHNAVCTHLRRGTWLLDVFLSRLESAPHTGDDLQSDRPPDIYLYDKSERFTHSSSYSPFLSTCLRHVRLLPAVYRPRYTAILLRKYCDAVLDHLQSSELSTRSGAIPFRLALRSASMSLTHLGTHTALLSPERSEHFTVSRDSVLLEGGVYIQEDEEEEPVVVPDDRDCRCTSPHTVPLQCFKELLTDTLGCDSSLCEIVISGMFQSSLAAGLPHFSTGCFRSWGRDTFIALPGLYLLGTGSKAHICASLEHIFAYASTLSHGLIPNLLDHGNNPRYNCRDAAWWFLHAIQVLIERVAREQSQQHADEFTRRMFEVPIYCADLDEFCTLDQVIYAIFMEHVCGIQFREVNAGDKLDMNMQSEGFNVTAYIDPRTSFCMGGNSQNCGTWMDKMGGSDKAGNRGLPATPRDGAAIEIQALLYSTLRWLDGMHERGLFKYGGVNAADLAPGIPMIPREERIRKIPVVADNWHRWGDAEQDEHIAWKDWADKLQTNFRQKFYIPLNPAEDRLHSVDSAVVHRRGIYKDTYKASGQYTDYQLRPNMLVAMNISPELFCGENPPPEAVTKWLRDPLMSALGTLRWNPKQQMGIATLDPQDWQYRPVYQGSASDDTDFHTAAGHNYHQGPEWVWPLGSALSALVKAIALTWKCSSKTYKDAEECTDNMRRVYAYLRPHYLHLLDTTSDSRSAYLGVPELTQLDGAVCRASCEIQAWSHSTLLEVLTALHELRATIEPL